MQLNLIRNALSVALAALSAASPVRAQHPPSTLGPADARARDAAPLVAWRDDVLHAEGPRYAAAFTPEAVTFTPALGAWNLDSMDSHGAWIMASADFAAVLASFALGDQSPLLDSYWSNIMWSPDPNLSANTLRGWFKTTTPQNRVLRQHNGRLSGTSTCGVLRNDGVGFVLFLNRDSGLGDTQYLALDQVANGITQWPNHDLFPSVGIPGLRSHVTGSFTSLGTGCAGNRGVPSHTGARRSGREHAGAGLQQRGRHAHRRLAVVRPWRR